jgi:predicted phage terminase large subunit-like protein
MRDKVLRYFEETLLSRLNDSRVLIFNIQQRLHIEDLSGHLKRKYGYYMLAKPLIDINGVCQIPSQYDEERIAEIKKDESAFQAQFQQQPTAEKGLIIKREWWQRYDKDNEPIDGQIIITADTAFKETKTADYSVLQTWELRKDKMLMRDMMVGKWEFPDLIQAAKTMWTKWDNPDRINRVKYLFIEDKASGTPLQQTLANERMNAIAWRPQDFDYPENKVARTKTLSWDVFRGMVYVPENYDMSDYLINEASLFAEDMSHSHDDSVDSCSMAHSIWKYSGGGQD